MRLIKQYRLPILIIVAVVITLTVLLVVFLFHSVENDTPSVNSQSPNYQTVLPEGKSINELGGWYNISPKESAPVYAYKDTVDDVEIKVSQQPIPDNFVQNVDSSVSNLAKSYNATNQLIVDGLKIYIGNNAKGPQTVIFTKDDILILITSTAKISDSSWSNYIKSLR